MPKVSLRDAISADVIKQLREERERQDLSMNVLAQRAGLSHSIISLVERDLRTPSLDTLLRITEALNIDLGLVLVRARDVASKQLASVEQKSHETMPESPASDTAKSKRKGKA